MRLSGMSIFSLPEWWSGCLGLVGWETPTKQPGFHGKHPADFFFSWPQFNSLRFWLKAPKDYETKTLQQRLGFYVSIKKQQRTVAFKQKYVHSRSLTARVSEKWWLEDYLLGKWVLIVLACGIEQGHFKLNTVLLNTCNTWTWNKCLITIPSNFFVTI